MDDFSSVLDDPGFLEGPNQDSVQWQSNTSDTMQSINAISNRFDKKEPDVKNSCVEIEGGKLQIMKVRKFREKPLAVLPLVLLNDEDKKHSLSQQLKPQKVEAIEDSSIETPWSSKQVIDHPAKRRSSQESGSSLISMQSYYE